MNVRKSLRRLILLTVLPIGLLGLAGGYYLVHRERATLERGLRDRALTLMTAVDAEIQASIASLEVLAGSPSLQKGDLLAFRIEAKRALKARNGTWANILLANARTNEMVVNLLLPPGVKLPPSQDPESIVEAVRTRHSVVGNVVIGGVLKHPVVPIRMPVFRGEQPLYVISAVLDLPTISRIVERQRIPESWLIAVLDGNYRFAMRRPLPPEGLEYASESLQRAVANERHGWQRGRLLDGTEIYRAFQRSSISHWSTSIAVPRSEVDQGLRGLWLLVAAFAAAVVLALWVAWWLASRISHPIALLAAAAPALGRGETSAIPPVGPIDEVRQLAQALSDATATIREREERQKNAEQALRAADRAKDEFLAMLGHELRNPLASVSNAAQLLKLARNNPAALDNVSAILSRQVEQMTRLVDDLLDVGRLTGGKIRLERAPLDLAQVVGDLIAAWRGGGRFLHHDVRVNLQPVWVLADRARTEQITSNLLDNALRYTPAGGRIEVTVRPDGAHAVLDVCDTGEGMRPELIARMFDLFVQGERTLAREHGGLGIGLTLAKRLVELHDGAISAASDGPGKGARFTVTLPGIQQPDVANVTLQTVADPPSLAQRVLIIEDNQDARETLAEILQIGGHDVQVSATAREGLACIAENDFDLVIVDVGLPDIDGYEIARRVRENPATRDLRLVALTGYGTQEDRRRALAAGFDRHLTKPVDFNALETLLRSTRQRTPRTGSL